MAVIKLDNITVAQTSWKPCSQQAWDQRFSIDLDRSRELEIGIFWRDWRSLCGVKFLRLEEFIDDIRHGMALQLEPKGLLFAEIKFLNPMISRKPKLQRQRMIFNKTQVKNIPRAKQMNINVATWGRLLKRSTPPIHSQQRGTNDSQQSSVTGSSASTPTSDCPSTAQPLQLVFDTSPDDIEQEFTVGEEPDFSVAGLSGARPLGNYLFYFFKFSLVMLRCRVAHCQVCMGSMRCLRIVRCPIVMFCRRNQRILQLLRWAVFDRKSRPCHRHRYRRRVRLPN